MARKGLDDLFKIVETERGSPAARLALAAIIFIVFGGSAAAAVYFSQG